MLYWQERLEDLRREQNPRRYPQTDNRPALHLPIPQPQPQRPQEDDDAYDAPKRGVIVIDL